MGDLFGVLSSAGSIVPSHHLHFFNQSHQAPGQVTPPGTSRQNLFLGVSFCSSSPEEQFDQQPLEVEHITVASAARIDNREQIAHSLQVPLTELSIRSDNWLIAQAYLAWGFDCLARLLGDFSLAIWDEKRRCLFLARDQLGSGQVYYYQGKNGLVFSTNLNGLLSWPGLNIRPDALALASSMTLIPTGNYSQTVYREVQQVPPGRYLIARGNDLDLQRYWSFSDIRPIRYQCDEDYVDAFQELFKQSVQCRLRSNKPIGILLSGGVDSASVAVEAADQLSQKSMDLYAYTSAPDPAAQVIAAASEIGDESALAKLVVSRHRNVRHSIVTSSNESPLAAIDRVLKILRHPHFSATNSHWLLSIHDQMQQLGLGVVLSGQLGNATISWPGNRSRMLRELLKSRSFSGYWRELSGLQASLSMNSFQTFKSLVLAPLLPASVYSTLIRFRSRGKSAQVLRSSPINPTLIDGLQLNEVAEQSGRYQRHLHNPNFRNFFLHWGDYSLSTVGSSLSNSFGIDRRDPTADRRLIEFCLGIPESQYIINGQPRQLIRRAMHGRLPDEVLYNNKRGSQSADAVWRVRKYAGEFEEALTSAEHSQLSQEYLDVARMRRVFSQGLTDDSVACRVAVQGILLPGIVMSKFLAQFEA
jgi:asparagine synthase (glutamine-hydrolysing)